MLKTPKFKVCRRLGARVFSKCENPKVSLGPNRFKLAKRKHPSPLSEYGLQMLEKQKAKYVYGLREKQFANYVKKATSIQSGNPVEWLYKELESRLDNVVYRLGFAKTHAFARQMVNHGHITVNGRRVTIPAYRVRPGDLVAIRAQSKNKKVFLNIEEKMKEYHPPAWLSFDPIKFEGKVVSPPLIDTSTEALFSLGSVLEFYSR